MNTYLFEDGRCCSYKTIDTDRTTKVFVIFAAGGGPQRGHVWYARNAEMWFSCPYNGSTCSFFYCEEAIAYVL